MKKTLITKLAGVSFGNCQKIISSTCSVGDKLQLLREPTNPVDESAIMVLKTKDKIGYIPHTLSIELAPQIDAGRHFTCEILEILGGDDMFYGVKVQIDFEEESAMDDMDFSDGLSLHDIADLSEYVRSLGVSCR